MSEDGRQSCIAIILAFMSLSSINKNFKIPILSSTQLLQEKLKDDNPNEISFTDVSSLSLYLIFYYDVEV